MNVKTSLLNNTGITEAELHSPLGSLLLLKQIYKLPRLPQKFIQFKRKMPSNYYLVNMNYLAHIYLSGDDKELKIGNFIADSVKGKKFVQYPANIQKGIVLHRAIDTYTDSHPTFRKSVTRLFPVYSHYSSVIVDILYDHFLAANWNNFSSIPLETYVEEFYTLLKENVDILPKPVQHFLPYMIRDNWLLNYSTVEGIGKILSQMNRRTRNRSRMDLATKELKLFYPEFKDDFFSFFPSLQEFVEESRRKI